MITRLHSALIDVADLETATRDYTRMLGAPPLRLERAGSSGTRSAFFGLANMALELREAAPAAEGDGEPRLGQAGIRLTWEGEEPSPLLKERGYGVAAGEIGRGVAEDGLTDRTFAPFVLDRTASRGIPVELICDEQPELAAAASADSDIDPRARVRSLDHVVVMSADPEATRRFYGDGLGLRLALDKTFDKRGVRLIFFRVGGTTIEIE